MSKLFLLIDDDHDDAELFGEALSGISPPVEFKYAEDGHKAFDLLQTELVSRKPDLVFLDLNMPEMNGWQCLAKLKKDSALRHIPVLMFSTSSYEKDKEIAKDLGAIGFFTKPAEFKLLRKKLAIIAGANNSNLRQVISEL